MVAGAEVEAPATDYSVTPEPPQCHGPVDPELAEVVLADCARVG